MCRLVEEVKQKCAGVQLQTEDVYMATTFQDFIQMFVRKLRGEDQEEELVIDYVSHFPGKPMCQLGQFSYVLVYFEHVQNKNEKKRYTIYRFTGRYKNT